MNSSLHQKRRNTNPHHTCPYYMRCNSSFWSRCRASNVVIYLLSISHGNSPSSKKQKTKQHKKYECIKYRRLYHLPRALNSFSTPFTTLFCLPKIVTQRIWLLQHFLFCFVVYFLFSSLLFSFHKHGATTNGITDKE